MGRHNTVKLYDQVGGKIIRFVKLTEARELVTEGQADPLDPQDYGKGIVKKALRSAIQSSLSPQ